MEIPFLNVSWSNSGFAFANHLFICFCVKISWYQVFRMIFIHLKRYEKNVSYFMFNLQTRRLFVAEILFFCPSCTGNNFCKGFARVWGIPVVILLLQRRLQEGQCVITACCGTSIFIWYLSGKQKLMILCRCRLFRLQDKKMQPGVKTQLLNLWDTCWYPQGFSEAVSAQHYQREPKMTFY